VNIDHSLANFAQILAGLDKTMTYVVYSKNGKSSKNVFLLMKKIGFVEVFHLSGGLTSWQGEGYETEKRSCRCGMHQNF
jgi:rhodanese-related sulfurtransferase